MAKNFEPGDHQREISDIRIKTGGGLVARSLLGMGWSLTRTPAKLKACDSAPMPAAQIPCVEMVALMARSDLEQLEGPWLELMQSKDPESVALAFRLALAHLTQTSKRLQMADVIQASEERLQSAAESESRTARK